jgi:hypothetical protein
MGRQILGGVSGDEQDELGTERAPRDLSPGRHRSEPARTVSRRDGANGPAGFPARVRRKGLLHQRGEIDRAQSLFDLRFVEANHAPATLRVAFFGAADKAYGLIMFLFNLAPDRMASWPIISTSMSMSSLVG